MSVKRRVLCTGIAAAIAAVVPLTPLSMPAVASAGSVAKSSSVANSGSVAKSSSVANSVLVWNENADHAI
jgi:hypothetical protein